MAANGALGYVSLSPPTRCFTCQVMTAQGGGAETGAETVVTQGPRFEILVCPVCLSVTFLFFLPGAPKRRKDREREKIYEPEDVDGGFTEFTLKSARRYEKT